MASLSTIGLTTRDSTTSLYNPQWEQYRLQMEMDKYYWRERARIQIQPPTDSFPYGTVNYPMTPDECFERDVLTISKRKRVEVDLSLIN